MASSTPLDADDHSHGLTAQGVLFNIVFGAGLTGWWLFCNIYQAYSTAQAIMALMQYSYSPPQGISVSDLLTVQTSMNNKYSGIATMIAWGVQVFLFYVAFPSDRAFLFAHKKHQPAMSKSINLKGKRLALLKRVLTWVFISGDIISDASYAWIGGGTLVTLLTPAGGARAFVAVFFAAVMLGSSLFAGSEGIHRFGVGVRALFGKLD